MDILLTQGFDHIGVQLFNLLDDVSLDKARQVCSAWKYFIETHKFYWKRSIVRVHRQKLVKSKQWTRIAESVVQKNKFQDMKNLAKVLRNFEVYHKGVSDETILWKPEQDPLTVAVLKGTIIIISSETCFLHLSNSKILENIENSTFSTKPVDLTNFYFVFIFTIFRILGRY